MNNRLIYKGKDIALICFLILVSSSLRLKPIEDGPAGCSDEKIEPSEQFDTVLKTLDPAEVIVFLIYVP